MGLLDRFKKKPDPLVVWLEEQGGRAHGRKLSYVPGHMSATGVRLRVILHGRDDVAPDRIQFQRPETYLSAEQTAALPSIDDPRWRAQMEDAQGLRVGGGFVLDPDFNPDSPLVARHIMRVGGYLERFSRSVDEVVYEPPLLCIDVVTETATPAILRRDLECANELLALLES